MLMAMVVIGGVGSTFGVLTAAIGLTLLPEAIRFVNDYRLLVFGGLLILVIRLAPGGLAGLARAAFLPREAAMSAALRLERVAIRFGGVLAVDDVSLEIAAGEFVGLIGPNGAGKTTLIRIVAGMLQPIAGAFCSATTTSPTCRRRRACVAGLH